MTAKKGKLIVIDGLDGSGKSTQAPLLFEYFQNKGIQSKLISFPDYNDDSSALVRMYLSGELSKDVEGVNAYAASSFYAVDRYASFKKYWEEKYNNGEVIIATRYTTSNAIHQMVKLPKSEWNNYIAWLEDYEYAKLMLPKPDVVIYLKMSRVVSEKLMMSRYNGDQTKKDLHERDFAYLNSCMETADFSAKAMGWEIVNCCDGQNPFSIKQISDDLIGIIKKQK